MVLFMPSPVRTVLPPGDGVPSVRGYLVPEHLLPPVARARSGGEEQTLCGKKIKKRSFSFLKNLCCPPVLRPSLLPQKRDHPAVVGCRRPRQRPDARPRGGRGGGGGAEEKAEVEAAAAGCVKKARG